MPTWAKVVLICGAVFILGPCVLFMAAGYKAANDPEFQKAVEQLSAPPPTTLANFNTIQTGMTYDQVVAVIGSPGVVQSENNIGGTQTLMYSWMGGTANISCMFQDGKLVQKNQFGLK